jgi:histidinol-phosphate/aromatic aminotransferase/cobyric acid decarboxylase-like protein
MDAQPFASRALSRALALQTLVQDALMAKFFSLITASQNLIAKTLGSLKKLSLSPCAPFAMIRVPNAMSTRHFARSVTILFICTQNYSYAAIFALMGTTLSLE